MTSPFLFRREFEAINQIMSQRGKELMKRLSDIGLGGIFRLNNIALKNRDQG